MTNDRNVSLETLHQDWLQLNPANLAELEQAATRLRHQLFQVAGQHLPPDFGTLDDRDALESIVLMAYLLGIEHKPLNFKKPDGLATRPSSCPPKMYFEVHDNGDGTEALTIARTAPRVCRVVDVLQRVPVDQRNAVVAKWLLRQGYQEIGYKRIDQPGLTVLSIHRTFETLMEQGHWLPQNQLDALLSRSASDMMIGVRQNEVLFGNHVIRRPSAQSQDIAQWMAGAVARLPEKAIHLPPEVLDLCRPVDIAKSILVRKALDDHANQRPSAETLLLTPKVLNAR